MIFTDDMMLNHAVEDWPIVDCLISFFSSGFPIEKAREYVELRKPWCVNDLKTEDVLRDRRSVYKHLKQNHITTPRHVFCSRDGYDGAGSPEVQEFDDYIIVNGEKISKPFVEKPVDAEDHNVYVYYPMHTGGGSKRLFRKVKNKSSEYYPHEHSIRREGSFIYEEFLKTGGTDIKVYTCGPVYAHAEARKAPTLDGRVIRDLNGKEVRFPIMLNVKEKIIATKVVLAFGMNVCGFDILNCHGKSYVCDVNGWSFVKSSAKYYDDAAMVLQDLLLRKMGRNVMTSPVGMSSHSLPMPSLPTFVTVPSTSSDGYYGPAMSHTVEDGAEGEADEPSRGALTTTMRVRPDQAIHAHMMGASLCQTIISVSFAVSLWSFGTEIARQRKLKMNVTARRWLKLFALYGDGAGSRRELKMKNPKVLQTVLDVARESLEEANRIADDQDSDDESEDHRENLRQIISVLAKGGHFSGINRKVQMKPLRWRSSKKREVATVLAAAKKWKRAPSSTRDLHPR